MTLARQPDLFLPDPQPELLEEGVAQSRRPDPEEIRLQLLALLQTARAAETMPWPEREARMWQIAFPQMTNWLPPEEGDQLKFAFAQEMERLAKAA